MNKDDVKIKTVNELYIHMMGEFRLVTEKIDNMKRITFWFGGIAGAIVSGVILGLLKLLGV
jgi:hypothetical protein